MDRQTTAADVEEAKRHASTLRATHDRNMATLLSWCLLFLLSPEVGTDIGRYSPTYLYYPTHL